MAKFKAQIRRNEDGSTFADYIQASPVPLWYEEGSG